MRELMSALGFNLADENFTDTPERFVRYLLEFRPNGEDPKAILATGFGAEEHETYRGMVVQCNIPFRTVCPHHLLPVLGKAHVAYIPNDRVVGLSKLTRVVQAVGLTEPQMQETATDRIAATFEAALKPKGVMVMIQARHMCMEGRGVAVSGVPTVTSSIRGNFLVVPAAKEEFMQIVKLANGC
jgi:GTP cyclohydrolase I